MSVVGSDDSDDDGGAVEPPATDGSDSTPPPTDTGSPPGPADSFEDGLHVVGRDIEPGRYIAVGVAGDCDWTRFADVEATEPVAAAESIAGQAVVDIAAEDAAFSSQNCGVWETYVPRTAPPATTFTDGDWVVGDQVEPGTYQSNVADSARCTWTHARGFAHTAEEVIDSHAELYPGDAPPAVVELGEGDRFSSQLCQPWTKVE
ncbi:MAG: hypothetical protein ACRD2C_17855 [Acidimicrobiales bacterium]